MKIQMGTFGSNVELYGAETNVIVQPLPNPRRSSAPPMFHGYTLLRTTDVSRVATLSTEGRVPYAAQTREYPGDCLVESGVSVLRAEDVER